MFHSQYCDDSQSQANHAMCSRTRTRKGLTGELIDNMKFSKLALIAAIACGTYAGNVHADQANEIQLVACECGEPVCGCEPVACCDTDCCDKGCDGGCDSCCDSGCDSGCGLSMGDCMSGCGDCCLGDPLLAVRRMLWLVGRRLVATWLHLAGAACVQHVLRQPSTTTSLAIRRKSNRHFVWVRRRLVASITCMVPMDRTRKPSEPAIAVGTINGTMVANTALLCHSCTPKQVTETCR